MNKSIYSWKAAAGWCLIATGGTCTIVATSAIYSGKEVKKETDIEEAIENEVLINKPQETPKVIVATKPSGWTPEMSQAAANRVDDLNKKCLQNDWKLLSNPSACIVIRQKNNKSID